MINMPNSENAASGYERIVLRITSTYVGAVTKWPIKRMAQRLRMLDLLKSVFGGHPNSQTAAPNKRRGAATDSVVSRNEPSKRCAGSFPQLGKSALIAGGWGYGNLGDEAILAGYLLDAEAHGVNLTVVSVDPAVTRASLGTIASTLSRTHSLADESHTAFTRRATQPMVIAGGGYLNSTWYTEVAGKLRRLRSIRQSSPLIAHATEFRGLTDVRLVKLARGLLNDSALSVRDVDSARVAQSLGAGDALILPDAISLLYPYVDELTYDIPDLQDVTLVNFLDVPARNDAHEAEFALEHWVNACRHMVEGIGGRVLGIAMDDSDEVFMAEQLGIHVLRPATVPELLSSLRSAKGLLTTRMHPALLSTMLGRPTNVLPYCGKVRPTLRNLGLEFVVRRPEEINVKKLTREDIAPYDAQWLLNYSTTSDWLYRQITGAH